MANQLSAALQPDQLPADLAKLLGDKVRLWMEKDRFSGVWQICAAVPGPREMTVRFDVPAEVVERIARFMFGAQAGFASELARQAPPLLDRNG